MADDDEERNTVGRGRARRPFPRAGQNRRPNLMHGHQINNQSLINHPPRNRNAGRGNYLNPQNNYSTNGSNLTNSQQNPQNRQNPRGNNPGPRDYRPNPRTNNAGHSNPLGYSQDHNAAIIQALITQRNTPSMGAFHSNPINSNAGPSNVFPYPRNSIAGSGHFHPNPRNNNAASVNDADIHTSRNNQRKENFQRRPPGFGFKKLLELTEMFPENLLMTLSVESNNLNNFLEAEPKPDLIVLFLKCLSKVSAAEFNTAKTSTLIKVCKSEFINFLQKYVMGLPCIKIVDKKQNNLFWNDIDNFFMDILKFIEAVINLIPSTAVDTFKTLLGAVKISLEGLQKYQKETISEKLLNTFEEIQVKFAVCIEEEENKMSLPVKHESGMGPEVEQLPPDDFREIQILPSKEDLLRQPDFLRPNIVNGAYKNAEHYLDVQFRLMREDFISPLRSAIKEYYLPKDKRKPSGARFYKNSKLLNYGLKGGVLILEICFDEKLFNKPKKTKGKIINSKRFMYGSLLCLTCDDFETIIFCSVENRDDVNIGKIAVEVTDNLITEDKFGKNYLLVESETYFPPYFHILKALQSPALATNFPFEDYIVSVKAVERNPRYMFEFEEYSLFNGSKVNLDDNYSWPSSEKLNLDKSQYLAYKSALCREFVTIQGPPGTGKTFIGLKIAETILENCYLNKPPWITTAFSPILVVCYTNHALDQFLEELLPITNKVVRIGGQSKNEKLKNYNLSALRKFTKQNFQLKNNLRDSSYEIESCQAVLKSLESRNHIFDITQTAICFSLPRGGKIMRRFKLPFNLEDFLKDFKGKKKPAIVEWLLSNYQVQSKQKSIFKKIPQTSEDDESDEDLYDDTDEEIDVHRPHQQADFQSDGEYNMNPYEFSCNNLRSQMSDMSFIEMQKLNLELEQLEMRLLRGNTDYCKVVFNPYRNAHDYYPEERWSLYWNWVEILKNDLLNQFTSTLAAYREEKVKFDEMTQVLDLNTLRMAHVVGVTTSGAARLQSQLRSLRSPIVIVEEAAEVMESHVVVSLTSYCQHLIMIGDHQQLRPITATYQMAVKFNLDISLFERMVKNGTHCYQLEVQHRMRPEIAKLITPAIYKNLQNSASVDLYPNVKGVLKNLYFVDHIVPETMVAEISSRRNDHEAIFLLSLAKYFIQQGYSPDEITILATYSGQMFQFKKLRQTMSLLEKVRINVLDNFQGEENKIILLSLVRSNSEGNIGFLSTNNRVCVALSRAREGFYIIGNMSILKKKSTLWDSVNTTLMDQDAIGPKLMLRCEIHQNMQTPVQSAADFSEVPEGGCKKLCGSLMDCGHHCKSICHISDRSHKKIKCKDKCQRKICDLDHECPLMCFQGCKPCMQPVQRILKCGHEIILECHYDYQQYKCKVLFDVVLPLCQHPGKKMCYQNLEDVKCVEPCINRLACGHACNLKCHKKDDPDHLKYECREACARLNKGCTGNHACKKDCYMECNPCTVLVTKVKNCTHKVKVECCQDANTLPCVEKCKRSMRCGHHCTKDCKDVCDEKTCKVKVDKNRSCGHKAKVGCSENPDTLPCGQRCLRSSPCGHPCRDLCYKTCAQSKCQTLVNNPFKSLCKHEFKIPCSKTLYDAELGPIMTMEHCQQPCGTQLLGCEHACVGTCGTCAGGRLHVYCGAPCGITLVCGHSCNEPCREACPPCKRKCEVRCVHSKCELDCGVPCPVCKHPCQRRCTHGQCTKYCGEECNIAQCSEACSKLLNCGHACRGLCGEVCPDICKDCKPDDFPDIFFGNEDDEDARFIKLSDCPHVVEVESLDKWMEQGTDGKISIPSCPHCKTPIVNTLRYSNRIKQAQRDIETAKKKLFGDRNENKNKLDTLAQEIALLASKQTDIFKVNEWSEQFLKLKTEVTKSVAISTGRQVLKISAVNLNKFIFIFNVLKNLKNIYETPEKTESKIVDLQMTMIMKAIIRGGSSVSEQQSHDLNNEIRRLQRIIQITFLEKQPGAQDKKASWISGTSKNSTNQCKSVIQNLKTRIIFSLESFNESVNEDISKEINTLSKQLLITPMTEAERIMIVKAMDFKQGHWYMCPNGHPYCITECGGAMVKSKCPDCGEVIGGQSHTLVSTNRMATFMDGATHSAWSDAANMGNYDLN